MMNFDPTAKLDLLGQMSADTFMKQYWQRKPLIIRNAMPNFKNPISFADLKNLAKQANVESRLVWQENEQWNLKHGPFKRVPSSKTPDWTLLVQSVDLHHEAVAELARQFRFIPDARFDDVMISIASMGGGVGPHFDTYDVFLFQAQGQRKWRISQNTDMSLVPGLPCKILENFNVEEEFVLNPGDMLYLPPHAAHDGISMSDDCMTMSFGFRTLTLANLARGLLEAAADQVSANAGLDAGIYAEPVLKGINLSDTYKDKAQKPTKTPAAIPELMIKAALDSVQKVKFTEALAARFIGCWLSEPNQLAEFHMPEDELDWTDFNPEGELVLDLNTRMLYHAKELYINGEALDIHHALLQELANQRRLSVKKALKAPEQVQDRLLEWIDDGWLHYRG